MAELTPEQEAAIQAEKARLKKEAADARALQAQKKRVALMKEELKHATDLSDKVEIAAQIRDDNLEIQKAKVADLRKATAEAIREKTDLETAYQIAVEQGDLARAARAAEDLKTAGLKLETLYEQVAVGKEDLKIHEKRKRAIKAVKDGTKDVLQSVTGISDAWKDTTWGGMYEATKDADTLGEAFDGMNEVFQATINPANIVGSTIEKIILSTYAQALAFDDVTAAVSKSTGAVRRYDSQIHSLSYSFSLSGNSARQLGIGMQELGDSIVALHNETLAFSKMNKEAQTTLIMFTSKMEKMGIQTAATAESFDILTGGFRMSADEAQEVMADITSLAMEIGVPPQKMADSFNTASKQLAAYGDDMVKVFKEVSASAKALNMDANELLSIVGQFDTFEGAATAVGNLNAVLGGPYLNSIQMVRMTEEERARAMVEAMEVSGRSWKDMGKYERKAVAAAAGIDDMNQANKLFGQSLSAYDEQMEKAEEADKKQQDFNEAIKEMQTLGDKVKILFQSMAVSLQPVFKALGNVVDAFAGIFSFITWLLSSSPALTYSIMAIAAAWVMWNIAQMASPLLMIIAAVALLSQVSKPLAIGLGILSIGWWVLGAAELAALWPILAVVAAIVVAIAVFYLMFKAIVWIIDKVWSIVTSPIEALMAFGQAILDFYVGVFNVIGQVVAGIVNLVIAGLNLLIDAINSLSWDVPSWVPVIGGMTFGFDLDSIPEMEVPSFQEGVTDLSAMQAGQASVVGEGGPEMVTMGQGANVVTNENTKQIMAEATGGAGGDALTAESMQTAFVAALREAGVGGDQGQDGKKKPIIMKLNDREFARAVGNVVGGLVYIKGE